MDCRTIFMLMSIVLVETLAFPGDVAYDDSMAEVVEKLQNRMAVMEAKDLAKEEKIESLKVEIEDLKRKTVGVGRNNKINQTLLPGGYSDFSVGDLQWQSLHVAAAAACRASTARGGHGPYSNLVYPRISGQSCFEVCKRTVTYNNCDASVSIIGIMGRITKAGVPVGVFYNYGCRSVGWGAHEVEDKAEIPRSVGDKYYGYCCCRH